MDVMRFSGRTAWDLSESSFAAALREARASRRRLWDLTVSNPTRCGFEYDAGAVLDCLRNRDALTYDPDPRGLPNARASVERYYAAHGASVAADQLLLTASTSESYSFLFRLLCDPGDEIIVAQPSYPLFAFLADLENVRLKSYPLFYDHGWWIDQAELERAISPATRAILVVHPNNPTGHWTVAAERMLLENICARHGLALIVDEVFLDYPLKPGSETRSFACGPHPVLTFVLSGLSKIAGLPQMKAAWIAAVGPPQDCAEAFGRLEVIGDTFLSMPAPIQLALAGWLGTAEGIQQQILARARDNLGILRGLTAEFPERLQLLEVDAGWSAIVALPACIRRQDCAHHVLRELGVVTHPGSFYGMPERNRIVVSLIVPTGEFAAGMRRAIDLDY